MTRRSTAIAALLVAAALIVIFLTRADRAPRTSTAPPRAAAPPAPVVANAPVVTTPPTTASAALVSEKTLAVFQARRPESLWQQTPPEETFFQFSDWARRYVAGAATTAEGVQIAGARREELAQLIRDDPRRALELAVPAGIRRSLPDEVQALLETPVSGRGDLMLLAAIPAPGEPLTVPTNQRFATIGDQTYEVFTFGRRLGEPSRWAIPLHGVALDGKLALSDQPARILDPVEVADAKAARAADPICGVSGLATTANNDETGLDLGDTVKLFCGSIHALEHTAQLAAAESALPAGAGSPDAAPLAEYAATGTRKLLLIRVDFSDNTADSLTATEATNVVLTLGNTFSNWSYGRFQFAAIGATKGAGSDVTPVYRMPKPAADYDGNSGQLRTDALAAATADGYTMSTYSFDLVCFRGDVPGFGYGGLAYVGAKGSWIHTTGQSSTAAIASHELGHNFGLNHASFYNALTGSVIGSGGTREEYGDPFDTMGGASVNNPFNARYKQYLDWLQTGEWVAVSSGGTTNRIYAHDTTPGTTGLVRGLRITRDAALNNDKEYYWVEFRTQDNVWSDNGVGLRWAGPGNERSQLLDTSPESIDGKNDAAILIGRTFSDWTYGVHITPIGRGGSGPEWIDVVVRYGQFTNNLPPTVTLAADDTTVATGVAVNFTATASDPDGNPIAYHWDYGDGTFGNNGNSPTRSHSYAAAGEYVARCIVTDMRGGQASDSVIIIVGSPSTFRISGSVTVDGAPAEDVRISVNTSEYTFTDSDGTYNLVGLPAGSYTVSALKEGISFARSGFNNPVVVGPNKTNINFIGGLPTLSSISGRSINVNQSTGEIPLKVGDTETGPASLVLAGESSNPTILPAAGFDFNGTGSNRTVNITPLAGMTGTVTNTITVTDPDGNEAFRTFSLAINRFPAATTTTAVVNEDSFIDLNLWSRVSDNTADSNLLFTVFSPVNGTVTLLADGHTARFTPASNYHGAASFAFDVTDKGFHPNLLAYYDFEPTDTPADNASSDRSGQARTGTLDSLGPDQFGYVTNDVPPALALYNLVSLQLIDNGASNVARLFRSIPTTEFNFDTSDWSFSCWYKRGDTASDDYLFFLGAGDGNGPENAIQLYHPAGVSRLTMRHYTTNSVYEELRTATNIPAGAWHHTALVYDRTSSNAGTLLLYFDGALVGSTNVLMEIDQTLPAVFGGHNSETATTERWYDGKLDEIALWGVRLSAANVAELATMTASHFGGLSTNQPISVTVNPVNDPPALTALSNRALIAGATLVVSNSASDVDLPGDTLTFSLLSPPDGATINPATGLIGWRPAITNGGFSNLFAVKVADAAALSATQQFLVTVNAAAVPLVSALALTGGELGFQVSGDAGPDYHLIATTNMTDWTTLQTWSNAAAFPLLWTDTNAAQFNQRFYEIRLGP